MTNITCPKCRFRHPANRTCAEAKRLADEAARRRHRPMSSPDDAPFLDQVRRALHTARLSIEEAYQYADNITNPQYKGRANAMLEEFWDTLP